MRQMNIFLRVIAILLSIASMGLLVGWGLFCLQMSATPALNSDIAKALAQVNRMKRQARVRNLGNVVIEQSMSALHKQVSPMRDYTVSLTIKFNSERMERCAMHYEATGPEVVLRQRCLQDILALRELPEKLQIAQSLATVVAELRMLQTVDMNSIMAL